MRQIQNKIEAKETLAVAGDVVKFVVRSATDGLQVRTSIGDVFPIKQGDRVTLKQVSAGLQIYNPNASAVDADLILMDGIGAEYEASAGAVDVANTVRVDTTFLNSYEDFYSRPIDDVQFYNLAVSTKNPIVKMLVHFDGPILLGDNVNSAIRFEAGSITVDSSDFPRIRAVSGSVNVSQVMFSHRTDLHTDLDFEF